MTLTAAAVYLGVSVLLAIIIAQSAVIISERRLRRRRDAEIAKLRSVIAGGSRRHA